MRSALPGRTIDRIRDGASESELRSRGDAAVWHLLVSTAASARQRRWSFANWADVVMHRSSDLGTQAARKHDTWPPKDRSAPQQEKLLRNAWDAAGDWLSQAPGAYTRETAIERVEAVAELAAAADLDPNERAVFGHAVLVACDIGTDRPALPLRRIADSTGLGMKAVRCALQRLTEKGWLDLVDPGQRGANSRRAALYRIDTPIPVRSTSPARLWTTSRT